MNNNIAVADEGSWVVDRFHPDAARNQGARDAPGAGGLDFAALMRIVNHWRWLILGAIAVGLLGAIIVTLLTTPMYRAWVTLEVNPPVVEIMDEKSRDSNGTTAWDFVATQVGLLSSRSIAERAAQDLNLANNREFVGDSGDAKTRLAVATGKVAGGLSVEVPKEGQLVRYSFDSESPQLAASIANQIGESFINSNLQRRYDASAYARTFLEKQIAKTRGTLEKSERQLVAYAQAQGIISTGSGPNGATNGDVGSLQGESLVALNQALATATARRIAAEGAYRQGGAVGATSDVTASTQAMRQQRATLEADYQQKRTLLKPDHPDMLSLRSQITELDRQIGREASQVASGRNNSLMAEYRGAAAAESALRARVGQLKGSVLDLRGRSIQYTILQRDVDTNRSLYDALLQRYKQVGVAGGVGTSPVSIVDRAEVPGGPYKPNLSFNLLVGLIIGLVGGLGIALAMEFINDTIKTRDDVRSKLMLACLGVIPKSNVGQPIVEELKDVSSVATEAYSAVLAALRFSTEQGAPKTLLLTSTMASEGKSSSALALAQNYARRGERVLLIDADLRRPVFKAQSNRHGLTKLLTNDESIRLHVLDTQYDQLYLLPCGPTPPNPADLLATPRFEAVLREAVQQFDRVIIDGPPVLGLADATLLATVVGSVLMVVESGKTRTRAARDALERLRLGGAHVVGAVLTKSVEEVGAYGYNRYKYGAIKQRSDELILISHQSDTG